MRPFASRLPTSYVRTTNVSFASSGVMAGSKRFASQVNSPFDDAHEVPLFDKLQAHPQAVEAINNLAHLMKEKTGVNLSSGDKPSLSLMYKLASDSELRTAAEKLMNELRNAGIAIDPHSAFQALKTMVSTGSDPVLHSY